MKSEKNVARGRVRIERYDPAWGSKFEQIKEQLINSIDFISIEHIGSTSVAGLGAKPIIDILITVEDISTADLLVEPLERLGYTYRNEYEEEMPFRRYFVKYDGDIHLEHIHVVPHHHQFHHDHIYFRDFLRNHIDIRDEYHLLKTRLANKHKENREGYQDGKSEFINRMTELAREELGPDYVNSTE